MIEEQIIPDHPLDNPAVIGLVHVSGATLGAGIGILVANQLGNARKPAGITLLTSGLVLMAPLVVASIVKGLHRSNSPRSVRRKIRSIREGADYWPEMENPDMTVR